MTTERIGILGGGQLARMLLQAAIPLGVETTVLAAQADEPAALVARRVVVGDWASPAVLDEFAAQVDVVILENEFVGSAKLEHLARRHLRLVPNAATLALIEDKALQKQTLADAGLPVPPLALVETVEDVHELGERWGWPLMLKTRRNGYDGKGTARVDDAGCAELACRSLGWPDNPIYAEAWIPFATELATLVIRSVNGEECVYPVVETIQPTGVCRIVRAPARLDPAVSAEATRIAQAAAHAVGALGILAVEMFLTQDGRVLVNELAPRPHNSGHYSIEGCFSSQFENAIRAALGWPLGSPDLRDGAAVMVNVLAPCARELDSSVTVPALAHKHVHVHWYDKRAARVGRKIGHVTAVAATMATAEERAQSAVNALEKSMCHGGIEILGPEAL